MSALQPLLTRSRYTDVEWEYASSGRCDWASWSGPAVERCGQPSDPGSFYRYCAKHDDDARDSPAYGK